MAAVSLLHLGTKSLYRGWQCYPATQPHGVRCQCLKSWDLQEQPPGWDSYELGSGAFNSSNLSSGGDGWVRRGLDFTALDSMMQSMFDTKRPHASRMDNKHAAVIGKCVRRLEGMVSTMRAMGGGGDRLTTLLAGDLEQLLLLLKGLLPLKRKEAGEQRVNASTSVAVPPESGKRMTSVVNLTLQRVDQMINAGQSWLERQEEADSVFSSQMTTSAGEVERNMSIAVRLLVRAVELKPTSLPAVGMLANALLVHGQVKLLTSQQLRIHRSTLTIGERAALERISQGCEQLLVEAGRVYRRALSINGKDFRALHNWGIALTCQAELLVNAGALQGQEEVIQWQIFNLSFLVIALPQQESSLECADKLYLAAIDKLEALVGLDRDHAAPALVNLALAVRGRSRVRNKSIRTRLHLLSQAQHLFRRAATLDPTQRVQLSAEATSCQAEMNELEV